MNLRRTDITNIIQAYDISKDIITVGEVTNRDAIEQSIEDILGTSYGERPFMPTYGSILPLQTFESFTGNYGEQVLDSLLDSIELWEDRIVLSRDKSFVEYNVDANSINLGIVYTMKKTGITTSFNRNITF